MNPIYARYGSDEFNTRLHDVMRRLAADVRQALGENLIALALCGSYGHSEGGVRVVNGVEYPYNDIDFVIVVRRKDAVPAGAIERISKKYGDEQKVEFDFGTPITTKDIQKWPAFPPRYDIVHGHRVLAGDPGAILENAPPSFQGSMPLIAATRCLLIPGVLLLWAKRVLRGLEPPPEADFLRRMHYKCIQALGTSILILHRQYTTAYLGRDLKLNAIIGSNPEVAGLGLAERYRDAMQFKFRPDTAPPVPTDEGAFEELAQRWGQVFLYGEKIRTGRSWPSLKEYVEWNGLREPEEHSPVKLVRNIIRNRQLGSWSWRYPREHLYRQLPVLLGLAGTPPPDWPAGSARFIALWKRFS